MVAGLPNRKGRGTALVCLPAPLTPITLIYNSLGRGVPLDSAILSIPYTGCDRTMRAQRILTSSTFMGTQKSTTGIETLYLP